jgi:phage tail-like protein
MKRAEIERLLPGVFRRTIRASAPLAGVLDVMEDLHAPSEEILAGIDGVFSAYRTPDRFVPMLAHWLDLARLFDEHVDVADPLPSGRPPISTGFGRLRALIGMAPRLSQWRGTRKGLLLFLETATGISGFEVEEREPFHIEVRAPESVSRHQPLIERILNLEKPAYVTYSLTFVRAGGAAAPATEPHDG